MRVDLQYVQVFATVKSTHEGNSDRIIPSDENWDSLARKHALRDSLDVAAIGSGFIMAGHHISEVVNLQFSVIQQRSVEIEVPVFDVKGCGCNCTAHRIRPGLIRAIAGCAGIGRAVSGPEYGDRSSGWLPCRRNSEECLRARHEQI
jgi:hypothetical protein